MGRGNAAKGTRILIRPAQEADAPALGHVMVTTYLAAHRGQLPDEVWARAAQSWSPADSAASWLCSIRAMTAGDAPDECLYVAADAGGTAVGLALGGTAQGAPPHTGAVLVLYVLPGHQGQGIGRKLVQAVAADLAGRGFAALQIGCLSTNAPARAFYKALGGQVVGERPGDEDGTPLVKVIYGWPDIRALLQVA